MEAINSPSIYKFNGTAAELRIYATKDFFTFDGQVIPQGSLQLENSWYLPIACEVQAGNVLYVPSFEIDSTVDGDPANAKYVALLFDQSGAYIGPFPWIQPSGFAIPAVASQTWLTLRTYNRGKTLMQTIVTYPSWDDLHSYVDAVVSQQLRKSSETLIGNTALSVDPIDPTFPIAVGDNDPRLDPASVSALGLMRLTIPPVDPTDPVAVGANDYATNINSGIARISVPAINVNIPIALGNNDPRAIDISSYASFAAALAVIGSTPTTFNIATAITGVATGTVPSTVTLRFLQGGSLSITTGQTLTILGPIIADPIKIFNNALAGQGTVSFTGNTSIPAFYPQWWGVTMDGATDDTAAAQACLTSVGVAGGGNVEFTKGTLSVTALTVAHNYVRIHGQGWATRIAKSTGTGDTLTFDNGQSGAGLGTYLYGTGIENVRFEPLVARTSGWEIKAVHFNNIHLQDLTFNSVYGTMLLGRSTDLAVIAYVSNIRFDGCFIGMKFIAVLDGWVSSISGNLGNITDGVRGVWLSGGNEGIAFSNVDVVNAHVDAPTALTEIYPLYFKNDAGLNNARFIKFSNCYFDSGSTGGWIEDGNFNEFSNVWFHGFKDAGVTLTGTASHNVFTAGRAIRAGTSGVFIDSTGVGNKFIGFHSMNNNASNTEGHGFDIAAMASYVDIIGCTSGSINDATIGFYNFQEYGIKIADGATHITVSECDFSVGNVNGPYNVLSTSETNIFKGNKTQYGVGDYSRAYRSTNQVIPDNTNTSILFDTDTSDPNSMHDTSSNTDRFVALTPGVFIAKATVQFAANAVGGRQLAAVRYDADGGNAITFDFATEPSPHASTPAVLKVDGTIYLAFGQYVRFLVLQTSTGNLNIETAGIYAPSASVVKQ